MEDFASSTGSCTVLQMLVRLREVRQQQMYTLAKDNDTYIMIVDIN